MRRAQINILLLALITLLGGINACEQKSKPKTGDKAGANNKDDYVPYNPYTSAASQDDDYNPYTSGADQGTGSSSQSNTKPPKISEKTRKCEVKYSEFAKYECFTDSTCRDCSRLSTSNDWTCPDFSWPDARSVLSCEEKINPTNTPTYGYTPHPDEVLPVLSSNALKCNIKYSDYALVQCYQNGKCRDCSRNNPYAVWRCPDTILTDTRAQLPCNGNSGDSGAVIYGSGESGKLPFLAGKTAKCTRKYSEYAAYQCFTDGTCRDCNRANPFANWFCPQYSRIDDRAQKSCENGSRFSNTDTYNNQPGSAINANLKCSKTYSDYSKYDCYENGSCRDCFRLTPSADWICPNYAWPDGRANLCS